MNASHLALLAQYNQWMNQKLYHCAAQLPASALATDRGAFFGSILGTLNHIAVGDTIWLKRFAAHPACSAILAPLGEAPSPQRLDESLFPNLSALQAYRAWLDELILQLIASLSEEALSQTISYANTKGIGASRHLHALIIHFFNHQTHHRGQVTTLLFQAGIDPGTTDLLALIPRCDAE